MNQLALLLSDLAVRWRYALLAVAVGLALGSWSITKPAQFDRSVDNMFAPDDPLVIAYRRLKDRFGGNEIIMAVYDDPQLFAPDGSGVRRLAEVSDAIANVEGVKGIFSYDRLLGEFETLEDNLMAERLRDLFVQYTHSQSGDLACILAMLDNSPENLNRRPQIIADLRTIMSNLPDNLPMGHVTGEPVMMEDAITYIRQDGVVLLVSATTLLALTLAICFAGLRWVLLPVVVVHVAVLFTNGALTLMGIERSLVSSMLTAIITVTGVAAVVHVIVHYRAALKEGKPPSRALRQTFYALMGPMVWCAVTDAVGFGSLTMASVTPVQDFGKMMAVGALCALLSTFLLVPAFLYMAAKQATPRLGWGEEWLIRWLAKLNAAVQARRRMVVIASLVVLAFSVVGFSFLEADSDFTNNFRQSTPIVRSYQIVESRLGGAGVIDVVIPAPRKLDAKYLSAVLHMEQRLRDEVTIKNQNQETVPGLTKVVGVSDAVVVLADSDFREVRGRMARGLLISSALKLVQRRIPEFYDALYSVPQDDAQKELGAFRIMLRANEQQPSVDKQAITQQVDKIAKQYYKTAETTGYFVLLSNLVESILRDQWTTFGVAVAGIGVCMLLALRSAPLALIALIPNCLPVLVMTGMLGWLGIKMNMGAAMIAAVSMGLSVDSSIHFLAEFRFHRGRGLTTLQSLELTAQSVGQAMVLSTIALVVGFSTLIFSPFVPTVYFGALVSICMIGGLAGNLIILPLLVQATYPDSKVP